jgi:hypothetical protein
MKKVIQKVAKHGATAIIGLLSSVVFIGKVKPILDSLGIVIDVGQLQAGIIVLLTGLLGGLWNFIDHRFIKTPPAPAK